MGPHISTHKGWYFLAPILYDEITLTIRSRASEFKWWLKFNIALVNVYADFLTFWGFKNEINPVYLTGEVL